MRRALPTARPAPHEVDAGAFLGAARAAAILWQAVLVQQRLGPARGYRYSTLLALEPHTARGDMGSGTELVCALRQSIPIILTSWVDALRI